jgi:hypothetical protein
MSEVRSYNSDTQPAWVLIACFIFVLACNLTGWIATRRQVRETSLNIARINGQELLPGLTSQLCSLAEVGRSLSNPASPGRDQLPAEECSEAQPASHVCRQRKVSATGQLQGKGTEGTAGGGAQLLAH